MLVNLMDDDGMNSIYTMQAMGEMEAAGTSFTYLFPIQVDRGIFQEDQFISDHRTVLAVSADREQRANHYVTRRRRC